MGIIAVAGGGAAGMMAAISAAECGHTVHLFEKNEKLGKKLYITGKGRCNITNGADLEEIRKNIVTNNKFMYSALYTMSNDDVVRMFEEAGVKTKIERGNRIFPESDRAGDVIDGLAGMLKRNHVQIHLNTAVKKILTESGDGGERVRGILTGEGTFSCDCVIIATGGVSYPSTGSTGDGHRMAEELGHHVTELLPALVPLNVKEEFVKDLQGLALKNIMATFYVDGKKFHEAFGEMLFTHFGVSGPVILSASSLLTTVLKQGKQVELVIDLKPALDEKTLDERIQREFDSFHKRDFRNSLSNLLPKSMIPVIISLSEIDEYKKVYDITREERLKLVGLLKQLRMTVTSTRGFHEAIITKGGVNVKEVNPATMESKIVKGLFFAGEILDVDAYTGGFNLQIAWSTGRLAGFSAE